MEELEGDGDPGCVQTPSSRQNGPPSKKTRLDTSEEETNTNSSYNYNTDIEMDRLLSLDDDEFTSLLMETPEIEDDSVLETAREETKTKHERFTISDYTEKISRFCQAAPDTQNNIKLSRSQLLRLGGRVSTKFRRSPV